MNKLDNFHSFNTLPVPLSEKKLDFDSRLEYWACKLNLLYKDLKAVFGSSEHYATRDGLLRFAYYNVDTPHISFFYILLLMYMEDYIPAKRKQSGKDFEMEWLDFQKKITEEVVDGAPIEIRQQILLAVFSAFDQINKLNIFEQRFSVSFDKVLYGGSKPLNGHFFLQWDKVDFLNGYYLIFHPSFPNGENGHGPLRINDENSRSAFNNLQPYFLKRLPPLYVKAKNGRITKVENLANLSSCITMMEHKIIAPTKNTNSTSHLPVQKKSISKQEARTVIKELKSKYLNFLCTRQLDSYNVICCVENRVNSDMNITQEYSFIFTIKEANGLTYLAYENASDSRCTYIFPVPKTNWQLGVDLIYEFFSSNSVNKRQSLSRNMVDLKLPGNYQHIRVLHSTNYFVWTDKIKYC